MTNNKRAIGRRYENEAVVYLEAGGYRLIDKNVWTEGGEIDLVMEKAGCLFFVEVKYRSSDAFGSPRHSITHKKKANMTKAAMHYLKNGYRPFSIAFLGILKNGRDLEFDFIENIYA